MSTNKVNLSLDEIISKRKEQKFQSNNTLNKSSFLGNRRNFGERRSYLKKDFENFSNKNSQKFRRNQDNSKNNQSYKPYKKLEDSLENVEEESFEIEEKNEETKGSRLFVSNLQRDVVNSELRKIFSTVGPLKRCGIHWDELGFSKGTADIEYIKTEDAEKALMFDTAEIEGVQMKVEYYKSPKKEINLRITKKRNREDKFKNLKLRRERNIDSLLKRNRLKFGTKNNEDEDKK